MVSTDYESPDLHTCPTNGRLAFIEEKPSGQKKKIAREPNVSGGMTITVTHSWDTRVCRHGCHTLKNEKLRRTVTFLNLRKFNLTSPERRGTPPALTYPKRLAKEPTPIS